MQYLVAQVWGRSNPVKWHIGIENIILGITKPDFDYVSNEEGIWRSQIGDSPALHLHHL
jgi:hypothetical protein